MFYGRDGNLTFTQLEQKEWFKIHRNVDFRRFLKGLLCQSSKTINPWWTQICISLMHILCAMYFFSHLKEVPWLSILTRNISSNFFHWVLVNMWVKKTACYRPLKNRHFIRVCTERMMDHQYGENGGRNMYSNYNQMRAYVKCSPNQSKILCLIDLYIEQSTKLWRVLKSAGRFCVWIYQSIILQFSSISPRL